jgi:hypothetical protein
LLELQALCPFRSFAQLRLQAQPVPEPHPASIRGCAGRSCIVRAGAVLARTADSRTLCARAEQASCACCVSASRVRWPKQKRVPGSLEPSGLRREGERAVRVLQQLIDWELTREPFEILALEWRAAPTQSPAPRCGCGSIASISSATDDWS